LTVRRKIAAVVGAILAGLLVLLGVALVVLHTPPARRFLLDQLISMLADRDVNFAAGEVEYNLIEGTATLRDVRVSASDAQDLGVLLRARRISATISLRQLIRGVYLIKSATVENPDIHVVIAENGRDNIPTPRQSGGDSQSGIALVFDQLTLTGGSLRFEDRRQHIDVVLPAWHISVDGDPS